jgi:hypothetical protein
MSEREIGRALASMSKIATDASGWLTLYRDAGTGLLWEVSYPKGEMHGGGPRRLAIIDEATAMERYPDAAISIRDVTPPAS